MTSAIAIVGPTAIGKSELALELSQALDGEIVSADSRQVYRYMDIGTAKPTLEERARVPHHLIDVAYPDEDFSLALYQRKAREAMETIEGRGKRVFIVGGTGLYVWGLLEGWRVPPVPPDPELRSALETRAQSEGGEALYRELMEVDPVAAEKIDPRNVRRVIRALEVCQQGVKFSQLQVKESGVSYCAVGLTTGRTDLYRRIDARVDRMVRQGLVEEVEALVSKGYGLDLPSMSGLGYKQIGMFLSGRTDLDSAIRQTKFATHRFVRHQYSWFSLRDRRIQWYDIGEQPGAAIRELVSRFIAEKEAGGLRNEQLA